MKPQICSLTGIPVLLGGLALLAGCNNDAASNAFGSGGSPLLNGGANLNGFITAPGGLSDALFGSTGTFDQTGFGTTPNTIGGTSAFGGSSGLGGTSGFGGTLGGVSTIGGTGMLSGTGFTTTTTGLSNPGTISTGGLGLSATNNAFGTGSLSSTVAGSSFGSLSGVNTGGFSGLNTFTTLSGTSTLASPSLGTVSGLNSPSVLGPRSGF